ncbi:hypothetical protein GKG76_18765 [Salmonella enterica]|nr:PapG chaperone-binding domain-containing protein [Salmonella enterica]ECB3971423.1 hypothetical protein [Salmonella enterica subsp. enterica serovar Lexington]ECM3796607.1 hypothetical protein [Salmonella enterica subsp. enterica serovar Newport]EDR2773664.1 hypothetical protein [Salmonella enterica subsp. enterica serovar Oslo]EDV1074453.1 hypothetical protein [Salmonella enterica subsp. enterica]EDW0192258.1 hypothetical protein [Salmonella enterica subsp. enterica serovar Orion]EDW80896
MFDKFWLWIRCIKWIIVFLFIIPIKNVMADNCGDMNLYSNIAGGWSGYGNVFYAGALFVPSFSAGLSAEYVATSGQTATYRLPSSVSVVSTNTSSYYTAMIGLGAWNNHYFDLGSSGLVWLGTSSGSQQQTNKSGQNCLATVRVTPINTSTMQMIGGISVTVGLQGGQTISAQGYASTVTPMTTLQPNGVRMNMSMGGVQLNLTTAGYVLITVPSGVRDGDYIGTISLPYSITACAGQHVCGDTRIWSHASTGISNINASIKIRVVDGKPVNPDTYCTASSGSGITINHGLLTPDQVSGNIKTNTIVVSCTGGSTVPVKIKVKPVGSPNTGTQLTGNNGILTPLSNNTDSLVSLGEERNTEKTVNVVSIASFPVNSELRANSSVTPGSFSGSAVVTISYQ